ncbi:hypothetical protein [Pseudomonas sp. JZ134]|uniref:hypothetical protein n=1 Tax=Pseudomonas sp. JZ134 TaxID=2806615 RepID=UPI003DA0044F
MQFQRGVVRVLAAGLIAVQLSGCSAMEGLQMPSMPSSMPKKLTDALNYNKSSFKGPLSAAELAESQRAASIIQAAQSGKIGYTQPEYQRRLGRFHETRDAMKAAGDHYTQEQFLAFSTALTDLVSYVDLIERGGFKASTSKPSNSALQKSYLIQPGQIANFSFNGYCLNLSVGQPAANEPLQLISPETVWPGKMASIYRNLMKSAPQSTVGHVTFSNGLDKDLQMALWTLQAVRDGSFRPSLYNNLSPGQISRLTAAGFSPQMITADSLMKAGFNSATGMLESTLKAKLAPQLSEVTGAMSQLGFSSDNPFSNPAILNNPQALEASLNTWLTSSALKASSITTATDPLQYSILASSVAAKTTSGGHLNGRIQVANLSTAPFAFIPSEYIANARSETQPVALANWSPEGSKSGVTVLRTSSDSAILAALKDDLSDLAQDKALKVFTASDSALLGFAKSMFKSKIGQTLVTSMPVVGNVISLGMLLTGKKLDGTDMEGLDYASAAIGMVPVAGNIAKLMGPGVRTVAESIARYGSGIPREALEKAFQVGGSDTFEYMNSNVPSWLSDAYGSIAKQTIASIPAAAQYASANRIRI